MIVPLLPIALIGAGVVLLLAALKVFVQQRRILEMVPSSNFSVSLPTKWNDTEITHLLQRYQGQPAVLSHVVSSIKGRMILNQDLKTAQQRLQLMASVIEVFKLNKEMQGILHDIALEEKEFQIKQIEGDIRMDDAKARLESEKQLRELRRQRDELVLKREIAGLQKDIRDVKSVKEKEPSGISPEQQRRLRRIEIEDKLQQLGRAEESALRKADSDAARARIQNMYSTKREDLEEQLAKFL
jgi:hypothetical protein